MKDIIFILLFFFIVLSLHGQDISVSGGLGLRPTKIGNSSIVFNYVDESPSRDNIQSFILTDKKLMGFNFNINAEYKLVNQVFFQLGFDYFPGQIRGFDIVLGVGYDYGFKDNLYGIRPNLSLAFGNSSINLGDVNNNDVFIQVNDQKFYSQTVNVRLYNGFSELRFGVDLFYQLNDRIKLILSPRYYATLSKKRVYLGFRGEDSENENQYESETISASNVQLDVNGTITKNSIIGLSGVGGNISVSYSFGNF